jgi:hypothetical protein
MARDEELTRPPTYFMQRGAGRSSGWFSGGRCWTRPSDPCDVNTVLYQLSALKLLETHRQISCLYSLRIFVAVSKQPAFGL